MFEPLYTLLFGLDRYHKSFIQMVVDVLLLTASFAIAMALRLEDFDFLFDIRSWLAFLIALPLSVVALARLGFYRVVIRYISGGMLRTILAGVVASAGLLFLVSQAFGFFVPRSVPLIYILLAFLSVGGMRFILRSMYRRRQYRSKKRVVIYGAGISGRQCLLSLREGPEYAPIAFVDDNVELQGRIVSGYEVHAPSALEELVENHEVEAVLLAIPSATRAQRKAIIDRLEPLRVRVQTIPGIADIVAGRATPGQVHDVAIEDLLGRDPIAPDQRLLDANIRGKCVMITGAGGSIGRELCRQILRQRPTILVMLEISEYALYTIHQELLGIQAQENLTTEIVPLLGSVRDRSRVAAALRRFGVETIYHAAAYKHVPMVEYNVVEGVLNNVFGTLTVAQAAIECGVDAFIMISTDKAVRPTNIMGASKRMAELICQAFARQHPATLFSMVRFGNVLGSSGSVIPLFRRQIAAGGPITVTHPEITRYFMLISEAAQLVIQAGAMAQGGEVFVLDMGEPVRIVDLAERMVKLSGLRPILVPKNAAEDDKHEGDIKIVFSGLRPGEKLYEELLIGNSSAPTSHPRIMTATEISLEWRDLEPLLDRLMAACEAQSIPEIRAVLQTAPIDCHFKDDIADFIWIEAPAAREPRALITSHS